MNTTWTIEHEQRRKNHDRHVIRMNDDGMENIISDCSVLN